MTNINCSSNCIYQKDGKCSFENIKNQQKVTPNDNCAYFVSEKVNSINDSKLH